MTQPSTIALLCFMGGVLGPDVAQGADLDVLAGQLAELRAGVETLATEVDLAKEDLRGRLRSLQSQVAEVDATKRREELRAQQSQQELDAARDKLGSADGLDDALLPVVQQAIADLKAEIQRDIPYRTEERRQALTELAEKLDAGDLSGTDAVTRLWAFIEDEERLAAECELDRQTIDIDGERFHVEVARMGKLALYFRTEDGRVGAAERNSSGWTWTWKSGDAGIGSAFDALSKGIRVGRFDLVSPAIEVSP